jgi:hypothetical protein
MTTTFAGTREFAQKALEAGRYLSYRAWTFRATGWSCEGGCCGDSGMYIEDVMSSLDEFCEGKYEQVKIL